MTGELARVTRVIRAAGLMDDSHFTEAGALFGTVVHALALGSPLPEDIRNCDMVGAADRAEGFLRWAKKHGARPEAKELEMADEPRGYAGRCDWVGTFADMRSPSALWLIDLKNGGVARWHGVQLAAYALLLAKKKGMGSAIPIRRGVVYLSDGTPQLREYKDRADFIYWSSALNLYQVRREWKLIT